MENKNANVEVDFSCEAAMEIQFLITEYTDPPVSTTFK